MSRKPATDLIAHVIATMAYATQAFEVSLDLDALDHLDREVLLDQLDAAGEHLADIIWALHPEWLEIDRRAAESRALMEFRRHRPSIDESARGPEAILSLLRDGIESARRGMDAARWHGPQRRYRDVAAELDFTADHLENALYLVDPDAFCADLDGLTPTQRVKLASRIEVIELELDEHREAIRQAVR